MVLLVALAGLYVGAGATGRWTAYPNYKCQPGWHCEQWPGLYDLAPANETVILYSSKNNFIWPLLDEHGQPSQNGGVPQRANLTAHLERTRAAVAHMCPQEEFSGNIVVDFEAWTPVWEMCQTRSGTWMSYNYPEYSEALVRAAHAEWSKERVTAQAKLEFETAGRRFLVETIKAITAMRPHAKVGMYGYPRKILNDRPEGEEGVRSVQGFNDGLADLWKAQTGYFPSVYLHNSNPGESRAAWHARIFNGTAMTMNETFRIAAEYPAPIRPYHWSMYHEQHGPTHDTLLEEDLRMVLDLTYRPPLATGLVIWNWNKPSDAPFPGYMHTLEGPLFKDVRAHADSCARQECSGHGWCSAWNPNATSHCICDDGYVGSACSEPASHVE